MFKSMLILGRLEVFVLPFLLVGALFLGGFVFYRQLHRSARYHEFTVFDALIVSLLAALYCGRRVHTLLHWSDFASHYPSWLDIWHYPGLCIPVFLVSGALFFYLYLRHHRIHELDLLDTWARAICFTLILYYISLFIDGSGGGYLTNSPLGLQFPGTSVAVYPVQLLGATYFLILYFVLIYLEKNYRTYSWYKGNRSQAKTGFVFFAFLLGYGLYGLLALNFQPASYQLAGHSLDGWFYLALIIIDLIIVYRYALHTHRPARAKK